jgi:hypothetical protein
MAAERNDKSLLNVLCDLNGCSPAYLLDMLTNYPEISHDYIKWLLEENNGRLITTHLKKNFDIVPNGFTTHGANGIPAFGRHHLHISVEEYFFSKHKISLKYPDLPCIVVLGGGNHKSYYPIECLNLTYKKRLNYLPTRLSPILRSVISSTLACTCVEYLSPYSIACIVFSVLVLNYVVYSNF